MTDDFLNVIERPCARQCVRAATEADPQILPATHGRYCSRCWGRIDQALIQAPELTEHILGNVTSTGQAGGERVDATKDAPLPFNEGAFADANELYSLLAYWCGIWADYLEVHTPAPAKRAWRRKSGTVVGLPAGTTPQIGARDVGLMTRWLRERLDNILDLAPEDVDEFDEAIRDVWRMNTRWPRIEKPRYSDLECPASECEAKIAVYPPAEAGGTKSVACDGGHYYSEEEFDELTVQLIAQRLERARLARKAGRQRQSAGRTDQQKADDVRAALWQKYGWVDGKPGEESA
ncbi:hypothetical protein [Agromyces aureus]|uniref:Uncharacterized protein n=1 Tax=Agromyces aureus TaxID=453304 RepID=A0A191WEV2_9MICO|nr:hypothetical protein [Agromyces aureus]ANJ26805.1 hypothetical protein ATC03_08835 [Agromyces aureus]